MACVVLLYWLTYFYWKRQVDSVLLELGLGRNQEDLCGSSPCISFVLHHLLKELPTEVIRSNFVGILHLIECSQDHYFDQVLPMLHACMHTHYRYLHTCRACKDFTILPFSFSISKFKCHVWVSIIFWLAQCLNYRLLGFRLSESRSKLDIVYSVVDKVIQVLRALYSCFIIFHFHQSFYFYA